MRIFAYRKISICPSGGSLLWAIFGLLVWGQSAIAQLRYDEEFPVMGYGKVAPNDSFSQLMARLDSAEQSLEFDAEGRGYLDSLLEALNIDPSSQVLVFSKTSLKHRFIMPENPRSLYFNDDVYVGYVPGSRSLEIGVMDPNLGPVFFDMSQVPDAKAPYKQETGRCLRCHDTYSLTGGGVPRFMLSSVVAGTDGSIVSHELSEITDTSTPVKRRWGGFYVTGLHGTQETMGNFIVSDPAVLRHPDLLVNGNRASLEEFADLKLYLRQTSDIVALLVLEHQIEVQNNLSRLNFESRQLLDSAPELPLDTLDTLLRPLLDSLFMAHEAPLGDGITGTSGYQEYFAALGPQDGEGRSLRTFDLQTRTFRYPLSYLIYSPAVEGLAEPVKLRLFEQIKAVLNNDPAAISYDHINADQKATIKSILLATKPEVLQ